MRGFRYLLIAVSLVGAIACIAALKTYGSQLEAIPLLFLLAIGSACAINFVFLLQYKPEPTTRIGRMFRMWLDAKEQELKNRSNPGR